mmetsp:Transcript_19130/g.25205  ORF Transcript_19130/g.25205 Transcript_19130/m.25205 type:complete len:103 (-) Transcript_19130:7-315(-)
MGIQLSIDQCTICMPEQAPIHPGLYGESQDLKEFSCEQLSMKLKKLGLKQLSEHFQDLGVDGEVLVFFAYLLVHDLAPSFFEETPVGREAVKLRKWLFPILV